jgi:hypothetical protein
MPFEMTMCAKQISQAMSQPVRPIEMTMCASGFLLTTVSFRPAGEIWASGFLQ